MKKILFICIPIIIVLLLVLAFIVNPKISYNKDINIIKNKITMVNNYLLKNIGDINEIKNELKKETVSNKRKEIERETNNYLNRVINSISDLNTITNDEKLDNVFDEDKLKNNIDDDIKYIKNIKEKLSIVKTNLDDLKEIDVINIKDDDNKKIIHDLFNNNFKIENYDEKINECNNKIDSDISKLEYLKKNKSTWDKKNNKIIFNKRANYNDYKKLSNDNNYELVKDKTGPIIKAGNITVTKGIKLNIKNKVSCNDAVDGKTECIIEGKYDTNKVGTYEIKIKSTDQSKNTTTKKIKVTVKAKVINKKPYYIEVIRNQNVVIVYGLDSNGEYKKIVKVFTCSVGKSSTSTPTGTYKTQDKAKWGWLVGNLYGQYYTRIVGSILFHSVPYTKKAKNTLEWDEYNKLGTAASKGCIRLAVKDVKWIYDNCPRGTTVKIYDGKLPKGVKKPSTIKISKDSPNKGWDPTDPDKNNPWKK